jgi:hypothetical protein
MGEKVIDPVVFHDFAVKKIDGCLDGIHAANALKKGLCGCGLHTV